MSYGLGEKNGTTEPALQWEKNILEQRSYYVENSMYNKPLVTKIPLYYRPGFHKLYDYTIHMRTDENLVMFHLSSIDKDWCFRRMKYKFDLTSKMDPREIGGGYADHWKRYNHDLSMGITCRHAVACLVEVEVIDDIVVNNTAMRSKRKEIQAFDNLGTIPMFKLDDLWQNATI